MKTNIALLYLISCILFTFITYSQNITGSNWNVTESVDMKTTWIERGSSGLFDTEFFDKNGNKLVSVYKVTYDEDKVSIQRIFSSDGEFCIIEGILNRDLNVITGTCFYPLKNIRTNWKAVINAANSEEINLTGKWKCNDNGIYYIRQSGDTVAWYGEQQKDIKEFTNVAFGKFDKDLIYLEWFDVPKGTILGKGVLVLKIISNNTLERFSATGDFGGSKWERIDTTKYEYQPK